MCNQEQTVRLNRTRPISGRIDIMVDACIADEVQMLNNAGVWTLCSCCGHGISPGSILIHESSYDLCVTLGYTPVYYYDGVFDLHPKSVTAYDQF